MRTSASASPRARRRCCPARRRTTASCRRCGASAAPDARAHAGPVAEAVARRPAQAGPLNSHVLVLQTLGMMRELSPDYLRRFIEHVETLQWLEQAAPPAPAAPRPARKRASAKR
ncbi:DUF2894 domain-containing protein [Ramlibacter terrae]|uniref:DUF2894 domain-containing protein n=1 Tax=Ramlibacter terrae TaxID=2732511 RepID=A0ABX6P899_9BURK|nr:DUF2894 domain-containing protein [Ramlibacter terrae]